MVSQCSFCGTSNAYIGFSAVECVNPNCKAYSERQYNDVQAKKNQGFAEAYGSAGGELSGTTPNPTYARLGPVLSIGAPVVSMRVPTFKKLVYKQKSVGYFFEYYPQQKIVKQVAYNGMSTVTEWDTMSGYQGIVDLLDDPSNGWIKEEVG